MNDPHYKRGTIRKDGKLYGRYPHVFKVQKLNRKEQPSTPLEIYTATIATMQKYASLTEDQVNNQSYSLVLEHLERLSKENEEMEKIRKK